MHFKLAAEKRREKAKEKLKKEEFINKLKGLVKKEKAMIEKAKEYGENINFIDKVNISYDDLDVSAKTVNGDIFLNNKLFESGDICDNVRYVSHELIHVLQQENHMVNEKTSKENYLKDPNEIEAFQTQVEVMDDHGQDAQEYLEHLVDYHGLEGQERRKALKKLTEKL
jgi:DNA-binding phage protein